MGEVTYIDPATGKPWVPAFPGQRPPFQPGNELHLMHGADSPRKLAPIITELIQNVLDDPQTTYLTQPRFRVSLEHWAQAAAKVRLLSDWVDGMDIAKAAESARGQTSPLELLRKWSVTEANRAARLGLDPISAARLGKDVAQGRQADAASELTRLRTMHEQAERGATD